MNDMTFIGVTKTILNYICSGKTIHADEINDDYIILNGDMEEYEINGKLYKCAKHEIKYRTVFMQGEKFRIKTLNFILEEVKQA